LTESIGQAFYFGFGVGGGEGLRWSRDRCGKGLSGCPPVKNGYSEKGTAGISILKCRPAGQFPSLRAATLKRRLLQQKEWVMGMTKPFLYSFCFFFIYRIYRNMKKTKMKLQKYNGLLSS